MKSAPVLVFSLLLLSSCGQDQLPGQMKDVKSDGVPIHYRLAGEGDTTLLFIHGAYIDQTYWDKQVQHFSKRYNVTALDLAAHGRSGKNRSDWSQQAFGKDVLALIETLDLRNVILIGHSLGGDVALEAAVAAPDRVIGIIGVETFKNAATLLPPDAQQQADAMMQKMRADFPNTIEQYVRMMLFTPQTDSAIVQRVANDFRSFNPAVGVKIMERIMDYTRREAELLQKLQLKLYLVNVPYQPTNEDALKHHTGAGYVLRQMTGTCHYPMLESPGELNAQLEKVLHEMSVEEAR